MDSHHFHSVQGGNLDPNNMRLLGGQMGSMLQSHLSGSSNALGALGTGLTGSNSARNLSEAMSAPNLTLGGCAALAMLHACSDAGHQKDDQPPSYLEKSYSSRKSSVLLCFDVLE